VQRGGQFRLVRADSAGEPLFVMGIDPRAQFLYRLTAGSEPGPGEVIVSEALARDARMRPGDRVALASDLDAPLGRARSVRTYRVSGVGDFIYNRAGEHSLVMTLADVRAATGSGPDVTIFGVAARPGTGDEVLAKRIDAAVPEVSAYSTGELMAEMDKRVRYFSQLATILGSVAMVVTALLVSTIITIGVRERFGEIATLRAIGVRGGRVLLAVVIEGLALAGAGCLLGLPLGLWMAGRLDRILLGFPGIPARATFFAWEPRRVALAMGIVIAIGAVAGCIPGLGAVRAPLGQALREEAE
jgi:putative ABC transport system permease protein